LKLIKKREGFSLVSLQKKFARYSDEGEMEGKGSRAEEGMIKQPVFCCKCGTIVAELEIP